ncbi:MAG: hypothetical protein HOO96_12095 [Polyangiaceae bacterium]|nr:hypothetical protein [Polyangiaceae bacterium]
MFDYFDLTGIDQGARPEFSPSLLAEVRALGFSELGWVAALHRRPEPEPKDEDEDEDVAPAARPSLPLVSYVMLHQDGVTTLALTKTAEGVDSLGLGTLFDDGLIVKTETTPPGLRWQIVARNIRLAPRHGYDFAGIQTSDPKALVAFHQERVRAAGATSASRAPVPGSTLVHIAMRVRFREVADPLREARNKWSLGLRTPVFLATTATVFGVLVVLGARGPFLILAALVAIACGVTCGLAALPFLLTVLVPSFVRDVSAAPRTTAEAMTASALLAVEASRARAPAVARAVAPSRALPVARPGKRWFLLANASLMPVLGFALMPKLGSVGPVAAMGIMMTADAAFMFITKQTRVDALRRWFFPALATRATLHRRASGWMRWGFGFAGAFLLLCARGWMAGGAELAPWVVFGWACVSALFGYYAWEAGADGRA